MLNNSVWRMFFVTLSLPGANAVTWAQAQQEPRAVLERYCKLDATGIQPRPRGWLQLARMFIPPQPRPGLIKAAFDKLEVIRTFAIGDPTMEGADAARFTVTYSSLGRLDYESLAFSPADAQSTKQSTDTFRLVLTTKHFDIDSQGHGVLVTGPQSWRIEGLPHEPHITVDAAISLVAKLRDEATSNEVKLTAGKTISALNASRE